MHWNVREKIWPWKRKIGAAAQRIGSHLVWTATLFLMNPEIGLRVRRTAQEWRLICWWSTARMSRILSVRNWIKRLLIIWGYQIQRGQETGNGSIRHHTTKVPHSGTKVNPVVLMSVVLSWMLDQQNGAGMMSLVNPFKGQFARWWRSLYEWNILHERMVELVSTIKEIANLFSKIHV